MYAVAMATRRRNDMPYSKQHKTQKKKNIALLAVLVALIVLLFAITIMRMGGK